MKPSHERIDVEVLLAQSRWMSGLVRGLINDPDAVDDIVQETWLRALQRPPRAEGGIVSLRAWLAQVARRLALRRMVGEDARQLREATVARSEHNDDAEVATERLRLQRELANYVLALDEPYRNAVILRYQEGLEFEQIAAQLGISEVAARQRVSRGLRRLRERLDREHNGDRPAWCVAYAVVLRSPAAKSAALGAAALLVWLAACALLVGGVATAWWFVGRAPTTDESARTQASATAGSALSTAEAAADAQRSAVPAAASAPLFAQDHGRAQHAWSGIVEDASGLQVAGALVEALEVDRSAYDLARSAGDSGARLVASTSSAADGSFELQVDDGRLYDLRVSAAGFATELAPDRCARESVRIALSRPTSLSGLLTRESDGTPVVGARLRAVRVWFDSERQSHREAARATSDARGRYAFADLAPGRVSIEIVAEHDSDASFVVEIARVDGVPVVERNFALAPGARVRGRVVDARTGRPIFGASIVAGPAALDNGRWSGVLSPSAAGLGWKCRAAVTTDSEGRFELTASGEYFPSQITAKAAGYGANSRRACAAGHDASELVEIALDAGVSVRGRVVAPDGAALGDVRVAATAIAFEQGLQHVDWRECRTNGDGRFELADLVRGRAHALMLESPALGRRVYDLAASTLSGAECELGALSPPALGRLAGSVVGPATEALAGAWITIVGDSADALRFGDGVEDATAGLRAALSLRTTRADERGRFVFEGLSSGRWLSGAELDVVLREGEQRDDVRIVRRPSSTLSGVVTDVTGRPLLHAAVVLRAEDDASQAPMMRVTHADGRFEFDGLDLGSYRLLAAPNSIHQEGGERMVHAVELRGLRAGLRALEVVLPPAAVTTGRVTNANGEPKGHVVVFARQAGALLTYEYTDADGNFVLRLAPGAVAELSLEGGAPGDVQRGVVAGTQGVAFVLAER